jgi:hypothetical protein
VEHARSPATTASDIRPAWCLKRRYRRDRSFDNGSRGLQRRSEGAFAKDRRIVTLGQFKDHGFLPALPGEILLQPPAKSRGVYPDDIVERRVVILRASEHRMADLLLVDFRHSATDYLST